jgi:hypothetical protein
MTNRVVKTKYDDEGSAVTILKPLSSEHENKLIVIYEDAYGEFGINLMTERAIINNHHVTEEELEEFKNDEFA